MHSAKFETLVHLTKFRNFNIASCHRIESFDVRILHVPDAIMHVRSGASALAGGDAEPIHGVQRVYRAFYANYHAQHR